MTRYDDCNDQADVLRPSPAGCGGWGSWNGPCGAEDCPSCHPTTWEHANDDLPVEDEGLDCEEDEP